MMVPMMIILVCTSLASLASAHTSRASAWDTSYNADDASHKLDEAPETYGATLWEDVKVGKEWGKWIQSSNVRVETCWMYDTEVLCKSGEQCQWINARCESTKPLTDVEEFCFSTPQGEELNQQQCDWLPYWQEEARKPSSKSMGKCEFHDRKIECAERDTCEAGELKVFTHTFPQEVKTFECEKECESNPDEGIKIELTQRCCAKCLEFKQKEPAFVNCVGCEKYSHNLILTEHRVDCEWSKDDRMKEICAHEGYCKTGYATTSTKKNLVRCGVVPCDPECLHDRQMYASCCEVCLEKMCSKNLTTGNFTHYGKQQDNQMCRGCVLPTTTTTTTTITTTTTKTTTCTPFCCDKVLARKFDDQPDELDNEPSTWLIVAIALLAASIGVLSGTATCLRCSRQSKGRSYRLVQVEDNRQQP